MSARRRQGKAEPRRGWSGAAPVAAVHLSASDIDLRALLPDHRSPVEEIVLALRDLGGRYQRYLHQDEFGPTRAERMAALRLLLDRLELLISRLYGLPADLRLQLSDRLARDAISAEPDVDNFQAYRSDVAAVQQIGEAAVDVERSLHTALMADLSGPAQETAELLCALDTTTAGAIAIDSDFPALEIGADVDIDLIDVATVSARIERLRHRVEIVLAGLELRRGPERCESLRWLVCELCDLYCRETGLPVTNSALVKDRFQSTPQSRAGRFLLAAVEALRPAKAWVEEANHRAALRRARILHPGGRGRAIYFAMREYVTRHSSSTGRRGRWERRRVTL